VARRVLILGAAGLLGRHVLGNQSSTEYVVSKTRISKNLNPQENACLLVSEALDNQCDGILFLAWSSNSNLNYDQVDQHGLWVSICVQTAILSIENAIHLFLVGTCLDSNLMSPNYYIKAKSELRHLLSPQIANESLTWFRPHYVFNFDPVRPRILQELLNSKKFTVHSPNSYQDYIFAQDVGLAITMSIENDLYGNIDIGSGKQISNRSFIKIMAAYFNVVEPVFIENPESKADIADMSRLRSIGWVPEKTLSFLSDCL
jgi:hypothetical protein